MLNTTQLGACNDLGFVRQVPSAQWYAWGQGLSEMSPTFLPALRAPVAPLQRVGTVTWRGHLCHLGMGWPVDALGARAVVMMATWVPSMSLFLGRGGSVAQPLLRVGRERVWSRQDSSLIPLLSL